MIRSLLLLLAGVGPGPAPKPRLVVVITVDQLRPDYLERYRPQLLGGFAMLLKTGASFTDAYQDHAVTETAPGHSTILSGRWPAHTGIIRNLVVHPGQIAGDPGMRRPASRQDGRVSRRGLRHRVVLVRVREIGALLEQHCEAAVQLGAIAVEIVGAQLVHGNDDDEPGPGR